METPSPQISAPLPSLQAPPSSPSPPATGNSQLQSPFYPPPHSQPPFYPPPHTPALSQPLSQDKIHGLTGHYGVSQSSLATTRPVDNLMHKNNLQHYCQKSAIPLPIYHTLKEEIPHPPRFRSTVLVDGRRFTSPNTFMQRKAAEQDVARIALEQLPKRIEDTVGSKDLHELICQDTTFCKMIMNEFAIKMNMEKCTYKTVESEGLLPVFRSSLVFNNVSYNGEAGKNKKEAEQLAARAAILSLLGDPTYAASLCEVIKTKLKLFETFQKIKQAATTEPSPSGLLVGNFEPATVNFHARTEEKSSYRALVDNTVAVTAIPSSSPPVAVIPKPCSGAQPFFHEFKSPNSESLKSQQISLPIVFVPSISEQGSIPDTSSSRKRRKNKRKAKKRSRTENNGSSDIPPASSSQPTVCSVSQ